MGTSLKQIDDTYGIAETSSSYYAQRSARERDSNQEGAIS
jgi:hypothetical protein